MKILNNPFNEINLRNTIVTVSSFYKNKLSTRQRSLLVYDCNISCYSIKCKMKYVCKNDRTEAQPKKDMLLSKDMVPADACVTSR